MAFASARTYECTSTSSPALPSGSWSHLGDTTWEVRAAWWPFVSAFVVRRPYAPPTLLTVAAETALLLENTNWRPGVALSWSGVAMSCPSHMSRFLTESLGLCIAIESASVYGWDPLRAILDADRLSKTSPLYVASGSRPDFIVQTSSGWHGIEARGRGSSGPVGSRRPVAVQKTKLEGMHNWSAKVATDSRVGAPPSWSMSWAWITDVGTSIDHFDPGEPVELTAHDEQTIWNEMSATASTLAEVDDPRVRRVAALDRAVSVFSRPIQQSSGNGRPAWLTVASWSEPMTDRELGERRRSAHAPDVAAPQELLDDLGQSTIGAFMATAITDRPPLENGLGALLELIVARNTDPGNGLGPTDELR